MDATALIICCLACSQVIMSTASDRACDPDIPSRLLPKAPQYHMAMAQGDNIPSECPEGEYLDWFKCLPCEEGYFRTKQMALASKVSRCHICQTAAIYEIVKEPCTKTRDTKIMCEDGYYRYEVPGKPCQSQCIVCDICGIGKNMFKNYELRQCGGYANTVCCEREDMEVVNGACQPFTINLTLTSTSRQTTTVNTPLIRKEATVMGVSAIESYPTNSGHTYSFNVLICLLTLLFR